MINETNERKRTNGVRFTGWGIGLDVTGRDVILFFVIVACSAAIVYTNRMGFDRMNVDHKMFLKSFEISNCIDYLSRERKEDLKSLIAHFNKNTLISYCPWMSILEDEMTK